MEHLGIHTYECNTKTRRHFNIVPSFIFFSLKKKRTDHECGRLFIEGNYPINRQKNRETATVIPTKSHNR